VSKNRSLTAKRAKISKSAKYDDPSAFYQHWPAIVQVEKERTDLLGRAQDVYRMGKVTATVSYSEDHGYFMTFRTKDRYPTYDEIVWLRYHLAPDACRMALIMPNLNAYINEEGSDQAHGGRKYVFTMEQVGWILDPIPTCPACSREMVNGVIKSHFVEMVCPYCRATLPVDMRTWNEEHGNGFNGSLNHD
jgi:hypothetical protein